MLMKIANRSCQKGIGLLELMLSLAIISVLLVMATRYYKGANQGQQINNAISLITGIAGAGAQYRNTHPNISTIDIETLVTEGLLPKNFSGIKAPWGGSIVLSATTAGSHGSVQVVMDSVPDSPCKALADSLGGTCEGSKITVIY